MTKLVRNYPTSICDTAVIRFKDRCIQLFYKSPGINLFRLRAANAEERRMNVFVDKTRRCFFACAGLRVGQKKKAEKKGICGTRCPGVLH